jgi:hypothetical protein
MTPHTSDPYFDDYFARMIDALEVLRLPANEQCEAMGAYNSSWELQHDVMDMIGSVITSPANMLGVGQADALRQIQVIAGELPAHAINAPGLSMTTMEGCLVALSHPAWNELRERASRTLDALQVAIALNRARLDAG